MSRSLKKGPFIDVKLEKRILAMNETNKKSVVKTWARYSMISPDFVGHTVAVHNGNKFIPVYVTENMVGHKLGARKRIKANQMKEARKTKAFAVLHDCPSSPQKMRLVADLVRGMDVQRALDTLKFCPKEAARKVEKLLLSAIANWSVKNEGQRVDDAALYIKEIFVDGAGILKRLRPAPQGRAHRIRKRSNHVTIVLGSKTAVVENTVKE